MSWDYAAVGSGDYEVPFSARGRSARRVLVVGAVVAAVGAVSLIAAMSLLGRAC